jgi:hypothetical protein
MLKSPTCGRELIAKTKLLSGLECMTLVWTSLIEAFQDIMQFATLLPFKVKNWKYESEKQKS